MGQRLSSIFPAIYRLAKPMTGHRLCRATVTDGFFGRNSRFYREYARDRVSPDWLVGPPGLEPGT